MPRYHLLISQVRVGFVPLLALIELAILLLIFACDVVPFWDMGLSVSAALRATLDGLRFGQVVFFGAVFLTTFLLPPIFICGITLVVPRLKRGISGRLVRRWVPAFWAHLTFSLVLAVYLLLPKAMEVLSGNSLKLEPNKIVLLTAFSSKVGWIMGVASGLIMTLGVGFVAMLGIPKS